MSLLRCGIAAIIAVALSSCSGHPEAGTTRLATPASISPGSIRPAPMAKTPILPASAMRSPHVLSALQGLNWSQIPGSASAAAASSDGSLWALSTQPAGPDKYIWHYAGGSWTNISGLAAQISVAPNGTLYAVNSGGGTYAYSSGSWTALGGGAGGITAASDGSIYVLSNGGSGADRPIWRNAGGNWSQVPGSGVALAASWDTGTYSGSPGTIKPGGLYILNSAGSIYYENTDSTFARLPGAASAIAPISGGVFVLGYPANANGNVIYYYDLGAGSWSAQPGAAVNIAAAGTNLYALGSSGAIYTSAAKPVSTATLYVASFGKILTFPANASGNVAPSTNITGSNTGLWSDQAVAVDSGGAIYVANQTGGPFSNGSITVYPSGSTGNTTPTRTIQSCSANPCTDMTGLRGPLGIAVDSAGKIYTVNHSSTGSLYSVTVYGAGASGNAAPLATIIGANTALNYPTGIALDASNNIWVTNYNNSSITEYAAGANGNAAPLKTIIGSNTSLAGPWGLAIDASGTVYVANSSGNYVTEYSASASGNAAPVVTLTSAIFGPDGIALDSAGNLYVSNNGSNILSIFAAGATTGAAPLATISGSNTQLNAPSGLWVH